MLRTTPARFIYHQKLPSYQLYVTKTSHLAKTKNARKGYFFYRDIWYSTGSTRFVFLVMRLSVCSYVVYLVTNGIPNGHKANYKEEKIIINSLSGLHFFWTTLYYIMLWCYFIFTSLPSRFYVLNVNFVFYVIKF